MCRCRCWATFSISSVGWQPEINRYFILSIEDIENRGLPIEAFRPILPSPRYLSETEILADCAGNPVLEHRLFLLDSRLSEEEIRERLPTLGDYLDEGKANGIADRYLCKHRSPWYAQENRPAAPFLCTYLGRSDNKSGRPFRFFLNHSLATAANVYLMLYPKGPLERAHRGFPRLEGTGLGVPQWHRFEGHAERGESVWGRVAQVGAEGVG